MNPIDWLNYDILGNSLLSWSIAAGVFLLFWVTLLVLRRLIARRLAKLKGSALPLDIAKEVVQATRGWFLFLIALIIGSRFLDLSDTIGLWAARTH